MKIIFFQSQRLPLHWAVSAGHTEIAEYLLKLGTPVDIRDEVRILILSSPAMHIWNY